MAIKEDDLKYLAAYDDEPDTNVEPSFEECENPPDECPNEELWWPDLNEPQTELFNCYHRNVLLDSERFSGKSYGVAHKIVKHCWETWDALVLVTTYSLEGLTSGLMEDLEKSILPEWEENINLDWSGPKLNMSKTAFIKIANKFGGWSTIMFKPCPSVTIIDTRFKPIKASMIVFEEMGDQNDPRFYQKLNQQLRRNHVKYFQFIAITNPPKEGPEHYLYEKFFIPSENEEDRIRWERTHKRIYFPALLNKWRDVQEYHDTIKDDHRGDPNTVQRLVKGEWVKQQLGDGIFKDYWLPNIHVKGDLAKNRRLLVQPNIPIVMGADMGDVNNGISFLQQVPMKDKVIWMQVDEIETVGKKLTLSQIIHISYAKMNALVMAAAKAKNMSVAEAVQAFRFEFIADSSTMRYRQAGGDIERELIKKASQDILEKYQDQYPYISQSIYFKPAPKGDGSVAFRVKQLIEMLQTERLVVDSGCVKTIDMFQHITSADKAGGSPFEPSKRSPYKHILDALTYPIVYHIVRGDSEVSKPRMKPQYY